MRLLLCHSCPFVHRLSNTGESGRKKKILVRDIQLGKMKNPFQHSASVGMSFVLDRADIPWIGIPPPGNSLAPPNGSFPTLSRSNKDRAFGLSLSWWNSVLQVLCSNGFFPDASNNSLTWNFWILPVTVITALKSSPDLHWLRIWAIPGSHRA